MGLAWLTRIIGDPAVLPLRSVVLNLLSALASFAELCFLVFDVALAFSWTRFAFDLVMLLLFLGLYGMVRFGRAVGSGAHLASWAGIIYEVSNFFGNGGWQGSGWMVAMVMLGAMAVLHEPRPALVYGGLTIAVFLACLGIERQWPQTVVAYPSSGTALTDLVFTFFFCGALLFFLILLVMHFYGESNERTRLALAGSAQTEKLAALGETMASLNHEISNPLGIMDLSLTTANQWWETHFPRVPEWLGRVSPQAGESLWAFLQQGCRPLVSTDRHERQTRRHEFSTRLQALGWKDPVESAEQLADFFPSPWNPTWDLWLSGPDGPFLLDQALRFLDMAQAYRSVASAHHRLMALVGALSQYSRVDQHSGEPQPVVLADSLDVVLSLFVGHRNKTVDVVRHYDSVPPVLGRPDELIQVWTNLVKNALSAMADRGTLTLSLVRDGDQAVVRIDDTGPGVPAELRQKIFEPFFTTKGAGKGTGLGLAVVKRIVTDHGGAIALADSPTGGARFIVRLPLTPSVS